MTLNEHPCDMCREQLQHIDKEQVLQLKHQITVLRRHLHSLRKRGLLERAAVLQLAACGGLWPEQ